MELLSFPKNPFVSLGYAFFTIQTEDEAIQKINSAYIRLDGEPPESVSFDHQGELVLKKDREIRTRDSISIDRFFGEKLLMVELFHQETTPPYKRSPIEENIMLVRYIMDDIKKSEDIEK